MPVSWSWKTIGSIVPMLVPVLLCSSLCTIIVNIIYHPCLVSIIVRLVSYPVMPMSLPHPLRCCRPFLVCFFIDDLASHPLSWLDFTRMIHNFCWTWLIALLSMDLSYLINFRWPFFNPATISLTSTSHTFISMEPTQSSLLLNLPLSHQPMLNS